MATIQIQACLAPQDLIQEIDQLSTPDLEIAGVWLKSASRFGKNDSFLNAPTVVVSIAAARRVLRRMLFRLNHRTPESRRNHLA